MDQTFTHYTDSDRIPDRRGNVRSVCGRIVNEKRGEVSLEPTCPTCAAYVAQRDAEPAPAWASEKWGR